MPARRQCLCGLVRIEKNGVLRCLHCDEECQRTRDVLSCKLCAVYAYRTKQRILREEDEQ